MLYEFVRPLRQVRSLSDSRRRWPYSASFTLGRAILSDLAFELVTLKSGIKSLRLVANQETFHPGIGPIAEARILHVQQQRLVERCAKPGRFIIWDVGLGAAANALCAIQALQHCPADVDMHSFDLTTAPLEFALRHAAELGYLEAHQKPIRHLLANGQVKLGRLRWYLHRGDFRQEMLCPDLPSPNAVFYDPYSAAGNREMWTLEHFSKLRQRLDDHTSCLVTNYTRSTVMRVTWLLAGFYVGIGAAIGEKAETTVASNCLSTLERPLGRQWLQRIALSHSASPLREALQPLAPIAPEDWTRLLCHPQFNQQEPER